MYINTSLNNNNNNNIIFEIIYVRKFLLNVYESYLNNKFNKLLLNNKKTKYLKIIILFIIIEDIVF